MEFKIKPWDHQLKAIESARNRNSYFLRFEPGCGKTLTLINILRIVYKKNRQIIPTLILSPLPTLENWRREITANAGLTVSKNVSVLTGTSKSKIKQLLSPDFNIFITNHESLDSSDFCDAVKKRKIKILVIDESQRFKAPDSKRVKKAIEIADKCEYRYCLSGTPVLNSLLDLWAQLRILSKDQLVPQNYYNFRGRFFYNENADKQWLSWPSWKPALGAESDLAEILNNCSSAAKKSECLDLPPFIQKTIYVEMSSAQKKHYKELEKDFLTYVNLEACVTTNAITKMLRLLQVSNGLLPLTTSNELMHIGSGKLEILRDMLKDITPYHKVIVWTHWADTYDEIARVCEEENIGFTMLTGKTKKADKQQSIDGFEQDPSVRVLIGNQGAGGVGINLQAASYSINYSKDFSLEKFLQAQARNYRGGSEIHEKIYQVDLVTKDSIEEQIELALTHKISIGELLDQFRMRKAA